MKTFLSNLFAYLKLNICDSKYSDSKENNLKGSDVPLLPINEAVINLNEGKTRTIMLNSKNYELLKSTDIIQRLVGVDKTFSLIIDDEMFKDDQIIISQYTHLPSVLK